MANTKRRGDPFVTNGLDWNTPLYSTKDETGTTRRGEPIVTNGLGSTPLYGSSGYSLPDSSGKNDTPDYYTTVGMPSFQTYSPTAFSGYQTYNPTDFSGWQQYQDNPYQGYQDFSYDPFSYQEFSYDYKTDPLYQMYAEQYTRRGQQSMDDTMSQVAARTGGVASSYAQAAAQSEYNSYMADLAAKIPELQQIARKMYDTDRNFAFDQYRDQRDVDYNNYLRGYNEDYNNWQNSNAIAQANVDLANNYAYNNWQARENANKYNVDTANQYAYANWQLQEAARQAAVNQANEAAMQQWAYQQQAANNNAQARLSAANAGYEEQLKAMQEQLEAGPQDNSVEGIIVDYLLSSHDRGNEQADIRRILADAVGPNADGSMGVGGFSQADADALYRKYAKDPMGTARTYATGRNNSRK